MGGQPTHYSIYCTDKLYKSDSKDWGPIPAGSIPAKLYQYGCGH
ncbi:MAG: hypothetical protein VKJ04_11400 [Vampirovibrionales bacterium]|nr:hypothetical protein [Vampirovibrionales bacterium]